MPTLSSIMPPLFAIMSALLVKVHGQNAEGTVTKPSRDGDKCQKGRLMSIILFALKSMGWPWHRQTPAALKHGGDGVMAARRGFLRQSGGDAE